MIWWCISTGCLFRIELRKYIKSAIASKKKIINVNVVVFRCDFECVGVRVFVLRFGVKKTRWFASLHAKLWAMKKGWKPCILLGSTPAPGEGIIDSVKGPDFTFYRTSKSWFGWWDAPRQNKRIGHCAGMLLQTSARPCFGLNWGISWIFWPNNIKVV